MNYVDLKTELDSGHPVTGAYNVNDRLATDELNEANITRERLTMSGSEIRSAIDATEYGTLSDAKKSQFLSFTSNDNLDPRSGSMDETIFLDIWAGKAITIAALSTLRNETISRAVELNFGTINTGDVQNARAL